MEHENFKIVYEEIVELHRFQQSGIDLIYNKLNWILVSDLVFIGAMYDYKNSSSFAIFLVSISAIIVLIKFQPEVFKNTAQISSQIEFIENPKFLESLINKKKDALNSNKSKIQNLTDSMLIARILLISAIILQIISVTPELILYAL